MRRGGCMALAGIGLIVGGIAMAVAAFLGHLGVVRSDPQGIVLLGLLLALVGLVSFVVAGHVGRAAGRDN